MTLVYRTAEPHEFAALIETMSAAFLDRPDVARAAEGLAGIWQPERTWAAFEGTQAVGTFHSWGTELTVPGLARIPVAAVSAVTVLPTHRRRGILTELSAREHAALQERGEIAAILYASEYPIYGRFGYGPATRWATWTVDTRMARMRRDGPGGVELVLPHADLEPVLRGAFERVRVAHAGEIRRRDITWGYRMGLREEPWGDRWKGFLALRRDAAGEVDGFVRYSGKESWAHHVPQNEINVQELVAATDEAYDALWRFLLELDLVARISIDPAREHERLPWVLVNARAARAEDPGEGLWVRLFDVARALETRTYEQSGSLVLDVVDPAAVGGRHRLALDVSPDGATCRPTDRLPDVALDVAALGAAYLGGTPVRRAVLVAGADEHTPGALRALDAMLRTVDAPHCSTFF